MRSVLTVALLALSGSVAHAHIHLLKPLSRTDDALGDPQKDDHCGLLGQARTARVTTYKPGETITVEWKETIDHPRRLRTPFQPHAPVFRAPPASTRPALVHATPTNSNYPTENLTGMMDPDGTGSMILMDRIPDGALNVMRQQQITLPNVECTNCTLQLIHVMTQTATYAFADDVYFQCADITLAANAPDAGVTATDNDAGIDPGGGGGGGGSDFDGGKVSGGCSTGGGTGAPIALALLGLVGWRRRRR